MSRVHDGVAQRCEPREEVFGVAGSCVAPAALVVRVLAGGAGDVDAAEFGAEDGGIGGVGAAGDGWQWWEEDCAAGGDG
jgi:hypothetical protein